MAYDKNPDYKLIFAGNRDEFYDRPSSEMTWWEDNDNVLAGRDLTHGGTWLGFTKSGKFATVTNFRDFFNPPFKGKSRGKLVRDFLTSSSSPDEYLKRADSERNQYDGYNLILYQNNELYYHSNKVAGYYLLPQGIYGLSNATLDTPWPKVVKGKKHLTEIIQKEDFRTSLFQLLKDEEIFPDEKLPDTGIGLEKERWLSSIFVKSDVYGTRTSTILTIDRNDEVRIDELTHVDESFRTFKFKIEKS